MNLNDEIMWLATMIDNEEDGVEQTLHDLDILNNKDDYYDYRKLIPIAGQLLGARKASDYKMAVESLSELRAHWTDSNWRTLKLGNESYALTLYLVLSRSSTIMETITEIRDILSLVSEQINE